MYINSGYLYGTRLPVKDKSKPLIVTSCGNYRLEKRAKLPTWRPRGRLDYQLLYVAAGKTHFYFQEKDCVVTAGNMVLFLPRQEQHYEYFGPEKPEVYWVHFTGGNVKNILRSFEIPMEEPVFFSGTNPAYVWLFKEMIREIQTCRIGYEDLLEMYLRQLFLAVQRTRQEPRIPVASHIQEEMQGACRYFQEHYNEKISMDEFAYSRNMSVSWFLRNFKQVIGTSPLQYLLSIRIGNAAVLLETTNYNVAEIADIVGYENPLYFSRIFKKQKGLSPSDYRKMMHTNK